MNPTAVASTTLATVAYDPVRQLLQLEFLSRAIYQYFGIPAVYEGLLHAPSKGHYFNRVIRGRFPYTQVLGNHAATRKAPTRVMR